MSRKKKRKYTLNKRLDKAYDNYVKRYKDKAAQMAKKGFEMRDTMLNRREYEMNRETYIREGVKININQRIVSDQAYEYSLKTARKLRKFAIENESKLNNFLSKEQKEVLKLENTKIKNLSIDELRQGKNEGLSAYLASVNDALHELKENNPEAYEALMAELPDDVKHTNQGFISWEVYGSK